MAEKKFGLGTVLLIGAAAAAVAGGVASYVKRAEIKRLAEDIISRVKPADEAGRETDDWDIRAGAAETDAADVNIVDSGISLESVEATGEDEPTAEDEPAAEAADEAVSEDAPESAEDAGGQPETDPETEEPEDGQPKKKTWFWSK